MQTEDKNIEYKSLRKAIGRQADLKSLAEECVAFANAQGGELIIGIEDKQDAPPVNQRITTAEMNQAFVKLRGLTDGVGLVNPEIRTHTNGGEYFVIRILPSTRAIATTSSGKGYRKSYLSYGCYREN